MRDCTTCKGCPKCGTLHGMWECIHPESLISSELETHITKQLKPQEFLKTDDIPHGFTQSNKLR